MPGDDTTPRILTVYKPDDGKPHGEMCSAWMTTGVRRRNTRKAVRRGCPMKATRFIDGKPFCDEHGPAKGHINPYYYSPEWIKLRKAALKRDGHRCRYCGNEATQADHIVARSKGGTDSLENLAACCPVCNKIAGGNLFESFDEKKRFILRSRKKIKL